MLLRGRAQRTLLLHNDHAQLPAFADAATGRERSPKSVLLRGVQRTLFRHDHAQPPDYADAVDGRHNIASHCPRHHSRSGEVTN